MITIYKNAYHVGWDTEGVGLVRQTSMGGGGITSADLSNYYTKSELQTIGLSTVNFDNLINAYHNNLLGLEGGDIADNSSGESSGMAGEYYHLSEYDYNRVVFLNFLGSLSEDASHIVTLVNDETSPGILKVYGTDFSGTKGWYDIVDASSGNIVVDQYWDADSLGDLFPINTSAGIQVGYFTIGGIGGINPGYIKGTSGRTIAIEGTGNYVSIVNNKPAGNGIIQLTASAIDLVATTINLGWPTVSYSTINIGPPTNYNLDGAQLRIHAGDASGSNFINDYNGGNISIRGGNGWDDGDGGNVYIYPGVNNSSVGVDGEIYFGDGANGYLLAKTSETNVVYYDPTTGKLSYGTP